MTETSPTPTPGSNEPNPKLPRSTQSKIIEAYITDSKKFLKGDVPDDTARFITTVGTSYAAAGKAPFAAKLTKRSYPASRTS